ncbi:hypothetical protein, partial [Mesorhizobium sp.]|uniref:hypothetical protein n=1 Tax=Mesorhizobium sp. TaxID=1871066 RepID=UPI00257E4564
LAGRGYGSVITARARKAPLGVHLQPIVHRLIVPDHLPEIPHIDRLRTDRADVKMVAFVLGRVGVTPAGDRWA